MKENKTVLSMPRSCFYAVTAVLVLGIITGSFCDFKINELLANKTDIGAFFATYGSSRQPPDRVINICLP